jgi:hypothetical protein
MNGLNVEERTLGSNTSLSFDIAKHLSERLGQGASVVVSKQPVALLASVRKQWLRVLRQAEKHRASTTTATKIAAFSKKIGLMQQADFQATSPLEALGVDVLFATAEQLLEFAPSCRVMYIATPTDNETLHKITSFMSGGGLVVVYRVASEAHG